jgi:hypothetical protein
MSLRDEPHYTLPAAELARWIESQPEQWWWVDGDPWLMSVLDLPCPSDELAPEIRKVGKDLLLYDKTPGSTAHGERIRADQLDALADRRNWRRRRTYVLTWVDSDEEWELREDEPVMAS